jgi:Ca2+-binding RTX toxin-like protein
MSRNAIGMIAFAALIFAAPAAATVTVTTNPGEVFLDSNSQGDTIVFSCVGGTSRTTNGQNTTPINTFPCNQVTRLEITGNDGADTVQVANVTATDFPLLPKVKITSGTGNDVVNATQLDDTITADDSDSVTANGGNDTIQDGLGVDAGEGDDSIDSAIGVNAGPGDDSITTSGGALVGGPGDDTFASFGTTNDGGPGEDTIAIEGGNTVPDTVDVKFTITDSLFAVQQSAPPSPPASLSAPMASFELLKATLFDGGTQTLDTTGFSGAADVHGLGGADTILAGPGADVIDGGLGNDLIDGGAGFDFVLGGPGADDLRLRDGETDRGDCGSDADSVIADIPDSLRDCETMDVPPPPAVAVPDTTDPETTALKSPKKVRQGKKAVFEFASSENGASFQCRVDSGALVACGSPYSVKTKKLDTGKHFFEVSSTDAGGNTDTSPVRLTFKVQKKK